MKRKNSEISGNVVIEAECKLYLFSGKSTTTQVLESQWAKVMMDNDSSWMFTSTLPNYLVDTDFDTLWDLKPETQDTRMMYGREVTVPRFQQSYINSYTFGGKTHVALPLPEILKPHLQWANAIPCNYTGEFNQVLLNWYQDGSHYISPHCDDEKQLDPSAIIVSISLGARRTFKIREKKTKKTVLQTSLENGTVVIMGGAMQKHYTHEVPKITGQKGRNTGRRINITYRKFI